MTAWGQANEGDAFAHMVETFGDGSYSVVSDSYDIANAVSEIWGKALHDKVVAAGGSLIVRPDSGDPIDTPVQVLAQLAYAFGTTLNGKGYKVLNDRVRVLQGDGITLSDINMILGRMEAMGFSADNMIFGMGASLLQKVNRDTYSFTMKANARLDDSGKWHDIFKRPANMHEKASKSGRQAVVAENNELVAIRLEDLGQRDNWLMPAWENGRLLNEWSFDEVRRRARA
jgi:nicotinamide phosphoribosyltransferase